MRGEVVIAGRVGTVVVALALLIGSVASAPATRIIRYQPATVGTPVSRVAIVGDSYTNGTAIGGRGVHAWPTRVWSTLARGGQPVTADVAAEGRAGYGVRGDQGDQFGDLTAQAVKPDDALVVFYGSRNDQVVDPNLLGGLVHAAFALARDEAPLARLLVIGPPWPTADVPGTILRVRDVLASQSTLAGATFVDPIALRWFVDRPDLIGRDGVHPTDAGHAYMADEIAPFIADQLRRRA